MELQQLSRRSALVQGGAAWATLAGLHSPLFAQALPSRPGEETLEWMDQPPANPSGGVVVNLQPWETLTSAQTPTDKFFQVAHYDKPVIEEKAWKLEVGGLVRRPLTLTLADIKSRPRQEVVFTLECAGNHGFPWFTSGIGTATWTGASLASLLKDAGLHDKATEVVFYGSDRGEEEVRQIKTPQNFARSMSVADALDTNHMLCYEMNGVSLPQGHGFPLRLIAPGWYGIANVKWLKRIEVLDTRYMGRFMARDYVTLREEQRGTEMVWTEKSVGRTLLKSVPGKVTRLDGKYRVAGAAWGAPIERVEVQIDGGAWQPASLDRSRRTDFAWRLWTLDWPNAAPGEHSITSRAIDRQGNIQPALDDPRLTSKRTYWESNGQVTRRMRLT
jgi:DMSO/TMAO reductase YedYZ molybdopterin-dependent catalytic subunit